MHVTICSNFLDIINTRHSSRVYTQEPYVFVGTILYVVDLPRCETNSWEEYATLRTVPSGGARHGFELYFVCQNV